MDVIAGLVAAAVVEGVAGCEGQSEGWPTEVAAAAGDAAVVSMGAPAAGAVEAAAETLAAGGDGSSGGAVGGTGVGGCWSPATTSPSSRSMVKGGGPGEHTLKLFQDFALRSHAAAAVEQRGVCEARHTWGQAPSRCPRGLFVLGKAGAGTRCIME